MNWKVKHIKEIKNIHSNEIYNLYPERLLSCKDILSGLTILQNGNYPSIMFLHTKTSDNFFVCFNCIDAQFEFIFKNFTQIMNNHSIKLSNSKKNIDKLKNNIK